MSWKKSTFWFFFQSVKYAGSLADFQKMWTFKNEWFASFKHGRNSVADGQAWLNFPALEYLKNYLSGDHRVFEYGGGGSTLFFGNRVKFVATVENDRDWFAILSEKMKAKTDQNWQGFFQEGEPTTPNPKRSPANPDDFMSNAPGHADLSYEKYVKTIHQFPESFFDVVLVDGRARPSCIFESFSHLKRGGLLVVDNMERDYYHTAARELFAQKFTTELAGCKPIPYSQDFVNTMILKKL